MASINPNWQYLSSNELKKNPIFQQFLILFDEESNDLFAKACPRSSDDWVEKYHAALRLWMELDPLKLQHIDFSLDIHDCGRIENSLVHKIPDEQRKKFSKLCACMYLYLYKKMFLEHPEIVSKVMSRLRLCALSRF